MAKRPDNPFKLALINRHPRDDHIQFEESRHIYTINGNSNYTSVTTFNHAQFEHFDADKVISNMIRSPKWSNSKYYGQTPNQIKQTWADNGKSASTSGTRLHFDIECFYNDAPNENESPEYKHHFLNFAADHKHLTPFRTEWMIYDEPSKLAGSVDMLFKDQDGLHIYDWKRCKEITKVNSFCKTSTNPLIEELPDTNYWHYCLQLNTYKYIIEKNYGYKVNDLYLVALHPDNENYKKIKVVNLQPQVEALVAERKANL
jgi:ATP-dependent exoDNAse (exonuclease V) beta subunit